MLLSSQVFSALHSVLLSWAALKKPSSQALHFAGCPEAAATNFLPAAHLVTVNARSSIHMCVFVTLNEWSRVHRWMYADKRGRRAADFANGIVVSGT